jgi:hypothetical protein
MTDLKVVDGKKGDMPGTSDERELGSIAHIPSGFRRLLTSQNLMQVSTKRPMTISMR